MTEYSDATLAGWFEKGDIPTAEQFGHLMDSKVTEAGTLAALKAFAVPTNTNTSVYMMGTTTAGDGGQGIFVWDSSDLSTEVAADPSAEVYVPPNSDATGASGAWVRQYPAADYVSFDDTAGNYTATTVESALAEIYKNTAHLPSSTNGYKFVVGVLRNTGSGWYVLDDGGHIPLNISSVDDSTGDIVLTYDFTASATITSVVTIDETLSRTGLQIGASVGHSSLIIEMYHPLELYTSGAAVAGSAYLGVGTDVTYALSGTDLTITHPTQTASQAEGLPTVVQKRVSNGGNEDVYVSYESKTQVVITALDSLHGFCDSNGTTYTVTTPNSGTSTATWDGSNTVSVVHPASTASYDVNVTAKGGSYLPVLSNVSAVGFDVQFYDVTTGSLVSGSNPPADLDFFYTRGCTSPSTYSPSTKTSVRRGPVKVNAQNVTSNNGNIWVFCLFAA
jgi:hypothetical protein